jgi:hypothetical protein
MHIWSVTLLLKELWSSASLIKVKSGNRISVMDCTHSINEAILCSRTNDGDTNYTAHMYIKILPTSRNARRCSGFYKK